MILFDQQSNPIRERTKRRRKRGDPSKSGWLRDSDTYVASVRCGFGPTDRTQLMWQLQHRSTTLWGTLAACQVVLGVLKCRCCSYELPHGGLDPRITRYITEASFEGLFKVPEMEVDHALITALVQCWRLEMHTFHLPHGEMGITLQDIEVMLGVPIDGLPVIGKVRLDWSGLCFELLGHRPLNPIPHPYENKSILTRARIRVSWIKPRFSDPLVANATDDVVQQHSTMSIKDDALLR